MRFGADFYSNTAYTPEQLKAYGLSFVVRYLSHQAGKTLTPSEAKVLSDGGLDLCVVFEDSATEISKGRGQGILDAEFAIALAKACGMPKGRPIPYAVDEDITPDPAVAAPYFEGVKSVSVAEGYGFGPYGGIATVSYLFDHKLANYGFQTYAWSDGKWDSRAKLQQYLDGPQIDRDRGIGADFGQWRVGSPISVPVDSLVGLEPAERAVATEYEKALAHPVIWAEKIKRLHTQLVTLRKDIWRAAVKGKLPNGDPTDPGWNVNNRTLRYKVLQRLTENY